jgi:hypothetical protein
MQSLQDLREHPAQCDPATAQKLRILAGAIQIVVGVLKYIV